MRYGAHTKQSDREKRRQQARHTLSWREISPNVKLDLANGRHIGDSKQGSHSDHSQPTFLIIFSDFTDSSESKGKIWV